jgi:hypothetical protein
MVVRRALFLGASVCALLRAEEPARADSPLAHPYDLPEAPRSLSLPELTHPDVEWTATTSIGGVGHNGHESPELMERLAIEVPVGLRRWFVGLAYEAADGEPIAAPGGTSFVGGNLELYGRTVWATPTGLAFGAGLGILPPIATFTPDSPGGGGDVALAAGSLTPGDYAYFRVGVLTARPFVDVRDLFGPFVVQFRQSFDWSFETRDFTNSGVSSASTFYFGWLASRLVGVGFEATEYYLIDAEVPDDQREKIVVSPSVRFVTPGIQPAVGAFVGIGSPLAPTADSVWGLRFALTFVWDPRRPFFKAIDALSPD